MQLFASNFGFQLRVTDPLEGRFGQYRQMSDNNYNVTVNQVLESEKGIKILSLHKNLDLDFQENLSK